VIRAAVPLLALLALVAGCGGGEPAAEKDTTSTILATEAAPAGPQKWTGIMSSDTKRSGSYPAANTSLYETEVELTVNEAGEVKGTGSAEMLDLGCGSGYCPDQAQTLALEVTGSVDDDAFALRFRLRNRNAVDWTGFPSVFGAGYISAPVLKIPKTGSCTAEGRVVTRYDNSKLASEGAQEPVVDILVSRNTVGLKCSQD
jgi:hypothetical protein